MHANRTNLQFFNMERNQNMALCFCLQTSCFQVYVHECKLQNEQLKTDDGSQLNKGCVKRIFEISNFIKR